MSLPGKTTWLLPVSVLTFLALGLTVTSHYSPYTPQYGQQSEAVAATTQPPPADDTAEPAKHGDPCANGQNDLCQQWRMAEATNASGQG